MLSSYNQLKLFKRTSNAALNPLPLDGGRGSLQFSRQGPYFMRATLPARLTSELPSPGSTIFPPQRSSNIPPPPHWHANQDESFKVIAGRGVFTVAGRQKILERNDEVFIPRGEYHFFSNASDQDDLVVHIKLNPDNRLRDERFFRNAYGYMDDCKKAGIEPSPLQALLLLWSADIIPAFPGPVIIMKPLSKAISWFIGVLLGKWAFGYREWYEQYTPEELRH